MRKLLTIFLLVVTAGFAHAQEQNTKQKITPKIGFAGGLWVGTNKTTTFIGFMGPKLSIAVIYKKTTIEFGLNGVPGLVIRPTVKLGLSAGTTITFKKEGWKVKPLVGVMFMQTTKWQVLPGAGFLF